MDKQREFVGLIFTGKTQKEACKVVGVSQQTGVNWMKSIPSIRLLKVVEPLYKELETSRNDVTPEGLNRKKEISNLINSLKRLMK